MTATVITMILAITGFLISLYMTLVYYGRINPEEQTCRSIVQAGEARILGIQNSILGMAYYIIIFTAAIIRIVYGVWPFFLILISLSAIAVIFSIYLAYVLIVRLRTSCPLCFTAQAINIALAIIIITSA